MIFPFKNKKIVINQNEFLTLDDYSKICEIPLLPHPGAFSKERKNHIHEGVDLYCIENEAVFSMQEGEIIKIKQFTGAEVGSPWWNDTQCILIESDVGVINYGEIEVLHNLKEGGYVTEGQLLGHVKTVLKKNKGRPMNMLHLELYDNGTQNSIDGWQLGKEKPKKLKDMTGYLLNFLEND